MSFSQKRLLELALANREIDPTAAQLAMAPSDLTLKPPPEDARESAVMLLAYPIDEILHLVFAKRPETLRDHPGQIAFPGGRRDPGESFVQTALRETEEELGVSPGDIDVLGQMRPVYVPPSNFIVHPFVGWHPLRPAFVPSPAEVDEVIEVPLRHFLQPGSRGRENRRFEEFNITMEIPFYRYAHHKIWGATATILSELVMRVRNQIE